LNGPLRNEPGVLDDLANELASDLYKANQAPEDTGMVPRAIRKATKILFDIDTAENGGPMDQPAYHIAILGKYRRTIQAMARAMLIKDGTWPMLKRLSEQRE